MKQRRGCCEDSWHRPGAVGQNRPDNQNIKKPDFCVVLTLANLVTLFNEALSPSSVVHPHRPKWKSAARFRPPHLRVTERIHSGVWNCVAS
jgi:hypothetical protein